MGHEPALVDAVAMKSSAELVIHAAGGHGTQCLHCHFQSGCLAGSDVAAKQKLDQHRLRKLWCAAETGIHGVEVALESGSGFVQQRGRELAAGEWHRGAV